MFSRIAGYLPLYGAHALKVFSFLILIPHFTSIFPKDLWGQILTVQALALWLQIVVEYGFNLSATRSMAKVKDDNLALSQQVAGVAGAKILLSFISVLISVCMVFLVPSFSKLHNLIGWGTAFAIVQGFNPVWYFLARGRFGQYSIIDFLTRLAYLGLCLTMIRNPSQSIYIFAIGIITSGLGNMVGFLIIDKQIGLRMPDKKSSLIALKEGWGIFLFVGVTSLYTTLNLVILGFSQAPAIIAAYGTSDRIVRAAGGLLEPLNRVIYSRLSSLYHSNFSAALIFLKKASLIIIIAGSAVFISGEIFAPEIIKIIAPNYPESVVYLRLLLGFIPILAFNNILGLHIMLPLGLDRQFNIVFLCVSLISIIAMVILTPLYGAIGMAGITILTEILACIGMAIYISKLGILKNKIPLEEDGEKGNTNISA